MTNKNWIVRFTFVFNLVKWRSLEESETLSLLVLLTDPDVPGCSRRGAEGIKVNHGDTE